MAFSGTKVSHARFVVGPFSANSMAGLAGVLQGSMYSRIRSGQNVQDQPARPLNKSYAKGKARRGRNPIRDWMYKAMTLDQMAVLTANENRATIGFTTPLANFHASLQNNREKQFGVSPRDRSVLVAAVHEIVKQEDVISVRKSA